MKTAQRVHTIERLKPKLAVQATELLTLTFYNNPLSKLALAGLSDRDRYRKARRRFSGIVMTGMRHGAVNVIRGKGRMVAISIAFPPGVYPLSAVQGSLKRVGEMAMGPKYARRYAKYDRFMRTQHMAEPHWYLQYMGVHPDFQHQGLGQRLVSHVNQLAKSDRVPVYLETDAQENADFYAYQGFKVLYKGSVATLADDFNVWTMKR